MCFNFQKCPVPLKKDSFQIQLKFLVELHGNVRLVYVRNVVIWPWKAPPHKPTLHLIKSWRNTFIFIRFNQAYKDISLSNLNVDKIDILLWWVCLAWYISTIVTELENYERTTNVDSTHTSSNGRNRNNYKHEFHTWRNLVIFFPRPSWKHGFLIGLLYNVVVSIDHVNFVYNKCDPVHSFSILAVKILRTLVLWESWHFVS